MTQRAEQTYDVSKGIDLRIVNALMGDVSVKKGITIRPCGVCPVCGKTFKAQGKLGFICPEHLTTPKRYMLDVWWEKTVPGREKAVSSERTRIYSTKEGRVLETFSDAQSLESVVDEEIRNHTFDPDRYRKQKQSIFKCGHLLPKFLEEKLKHSAPSYKKHYEQHVAILTAYFKDTDVREIKKLDLKNLIDHLEKTYVTPGTWKWKTLKNCAEKMRTFLNWVKADLDLIQTVPAFPEIETDDPIHKWVRADGQLQLFEAVREEDRPIVGFLMLHGIRPGEARALRCKDVDLEGKGELIIHATFSGKEYRERRKGKKAKPLYAPIHPEARPFIEQVVKGSHPEAYVFLNPRTGRPYTESAMTRLWGRVKKVFPGIRLYDASRHSYVSQLIAAGVSIYTASKLVGHTSVKTTEKTYAHADLDSMRAEITKVSLKPKLVSIESVRDLSVDGKDNGKQ